MYAALKNVTGPAKPPVTWKQVFSHLRLDSDTDEDLVWGYVQAATQWIESYLDLSLITQTFQYTISDHLFVSDLYLLTLPLSISQLYRGPHQYIELPRGPVQSIARVWYNSNDGTATDLTNWTGNLSASPATLSLNYSSNASISNMQVQYVSGFGTEPDSVPIAIRHAVLMLASFLYENRGDTSDSDMPRSVTRLLSMYRVPSFS